MVQFNLKQNMVVDTKKHSSFIYLELSIINETTI